MILTSWAFSLVESTHTDSYLSKIRTCRPIKDSNLQIIHHLPQKNTIIFHSSATIVTEIGDSYTLSANDFT